MLLSLCLRLYARCHGIGYYHAGIFAGWGAVNCTMTRAIRECVILTLTDKSDRKAVFFLKKSLTKRANADLKSRFSSSRRRGRPSFVTTSSKLETDCCGKPVQLYGGSDGHQICPNVLYIDDTHTLTHTPDLS